MYIFDQEVWDVVCKGTKKERTFITQESMLYFFMYYSAPKIKYPFADFHYEYFDDIDRLNRGEIDTVVWIAFRESAKTSIARSACTQQIAYRNHASMNYISYEKANAETGLYDIAIDLQTNEKYKHDFGTLYWPEKKYMFDRRETESKMKRLDNFITEDVRGMGKVKVEALSTQRSARGRVVGKEADRPGFTVFDDIETRKTIRSRAYTKQIKDGVDEAVSGMAPNHSKIFLGNYISDDGVIEYIMKKYRDDPRAVVRNYGIHDEQGRIRWPDKYVETDKEAEEINQKLREDMKKALRTDPTVKKYVQLAVSLESKQRELQYYDSEMENNPVSDEDLYFDRDKVEDDLKRVRKPEEVIAGQRIFFKYKPRHMYALGADTAAGVGRDSSATTIIDFTTTPSKVVATYDNNQIDPTDFAWAIKKHGDAYGHCFAVPEINNTGYAVVGELVDEDGCNYQEVYTRQVKDKIKKQFVERYGFHTNFSTKHDVFSQFQKAYEDGELEIFDEKLLTEMKYFKFSDLETIEKKDDEDTTRHFDLLTSAVLAWEGRKYATPSEEDRKKRYKAPKREPFKA